MTSESNNFGLPKACTLTQNKCLGKEFLKKICIVYHEVVNILV